VAGDRLSGQAVVFLPGLLCDAQLWQPQIDALGARITPWVVDLARDDSMGGMAARVLAECPFGRFALAGLSMGGYVALELMRRAPERVARLALLDTQARPETPEATARRLALIELAKRGKFAAVADRLMPLLLHPSRIDEPQLTAVVRSMARNIGPDAFLRQQQAIMARPDSRESLHKIGCPTLVLCGDGDLLTPPERHEEIARSVRGAQLVLLRDCGHLATLEQPGEVSRALERWLETGGG